jgi:ribosomal protein S18 acetylase RimI-like enzyme
MIAPAFVVRRVRPEDWPRLRALRLEALEDTPMGFLERYEDALKVADEGWQFRAHRGSEAGDSAQFIAELRPTMRSASGAEEADQWRRDGSFLGTMVGFPDTSGSDEVWLAAVYVTPAWRGRGRAVTDALLDAVVDWARSRNASRMLLEVHEDNASARAFYRRRGFVETGQRKPYPLDPSADELVMALPLHPSNGRSL